MEDHAGIAQLVEMYASMIYRIAYTRMQNVADAEDITQEVLLKYLKADKTFRDEEHRKMWLIRVTVNTIKSNVTSAWRRHTVALDDVTEPSYEASDLPVLKEKVEKLPERYRLPMFLYYYEELSVKEIAHVTKSTEGTVKSLLSRGRKMLRDEWKEDGYVREHEEDISSVCGFDCTRTGHAGTPETATVCGNAGRTPQETKLWKRAILPVVGCSLYAVPCEWRLPDLCGNWHLRTDREGRRPLDHRS